MAYGKGIKIYRSLAKRSTRASINQKYSSAAYRRSTSSRFTAVERAIDRGPVAVVSVPSNVAAVSGSSGSSTSSSVSLSSLTSAPNAKLGGAIDANGYPIINTNVKKLQGGLQLNNVVIPNELPFEGAVLTVAQSPAGTPEEWNATTMVDVNGVQTT